MSLSEFEIKKIEKTVGEYIEKNAPLSKSVMRLIWVIELKIKV